MEIEVLTQRLIWEALRQAKDPEAGLSVVDLDMIHEVNVGDEEIQVEVVLTVPLCAPAGLIADRVGEALLAVPGIKTAKVTLLFEWQGRESHRANAQTNDRPKNKTRPAHVVLLTAPSGLGKTTACLRAVELAQACGLRVSGLLSLPVVQDGIKTAITLRDIGTGRERVLARANQDGTGPQMGIWTFNPKSVAWGQRVLASLTPCDLLVIDEIGPLELEMGQGLTKALDVLRHGAYRWALVTMRHTLAETITAQLEGLDVSVMALDEQNRDQMPQTIVAQCFELKR